MIDVFDREIRVRRWCLGKTPMQTFLMQCDDEEENDRGLMATDTKAPSLNQAPPSGRVPANTLVFDLILE